METVDFLASLEVHGGHGAPWIAMDSMDLFMIFDRIAMFFQILHDVSMMFHCYVLLAACCWMLLEGILWDFEQNPSRKCESEGFP